jgi:hypothetical protein
MAWLCLVRNLKKTLNKQMKSEWYIGKEILS